MHTRDTIRTGRKTHKKKQSRRLSSILAKPRTLAVFALIALVVSGMLLPGIRSQIFADTCSSISDCQSKIAASSSALSDLKSTALSYQDAIDRLNSQISSLQGQIDYNVSEQNRLQGEIDKAQAEINKQRSILAQGVKAMYVDGTPSTLEMVATSKNLSDYVDKAEYRTAVQRKLQDTLKKIAELQKQLSVQKAQVADLLKEQQQQQTQLVAARTEQANMLAYNKQQQDSFNADVAANQKKLSELIAAQRRANQSGNNGALVAGTSSYAYANYAFSMSPGGCGPGEGPDVWGYCTRQCVSYAAWAVAHSGRSAPMYYGNANQWVRHALNDGVPVYSFSNPSGYSGVHQGGPQPGDVAISVSGTWGHAMYVESVSGTQVYVSQYNAGLNGEFSYQWRDASNYYFLRF